MKKQEYKEWTMCSKYRVIFKPDYDWCGLCGHGKNLIVVVAKDKQPSRNVVFTNPAWKEKQ